MTESHHEPAREQQARRTARARKGVVAAGAVGALGTALAIGISTQTGSTPTATQENGVGGQQDGWTGDEDRSDDLGQGQQHDDDESDDDGSDDDGSDDDGSDDDGSDDDDFDEGRQPEQAAPEDGGQLAVPGNGAPQAHSSGS